MQEAAEEDGETMFDDNSNFKLTVSEGYNNELFVIKKPVIIKNVISSVLGEIEKSRKALENEFLS